MKKLSYILILGLLAPVFVSAQLSILRPSQGGTGIGSAVVGDIGKCLKVLTATPFVYEVGTCGAGGFAWPFTKQADGSQGTTTVMSFLGGLYSSASSTFTYASTTQIGSTGNAYFATSNGGVGIGMIPVFKLDVTGSIRAIAETAAIDITNNGIVVQRSSNDSVLSIGYRTNPNAWGIAATYSSTGAYRPIVFYTSDAERVRIDTAGSLGIGTSSPSSKLSVSGNSFFDGKITAADIVATSTLLATTATTTNATSTNFYVSGTLSAANVYDTGLSGATCVGESNGLIGTSNCVSSVNSAGNTLTVSPTTGAVDVALKLNHANDWTALQTFTNATSTLFSSQYASTTILCISNDCRTAWPTSSMTFAWPFTKQADGYHATSTGMLFSGGFVSTASTTIGNNTTATGLTIFGGATTTGQMLNLGSTTLQVFSASAGTTTSATSTNLYSLSQFLALGSTTLQNFTAINGTTTNATSTNLSVSGLASTTSFRANTALFGGSVGIASSTPFSLLALGSGSITVAENKLSTSTSMTVDWNVGNQQLIQKGTSAITLSFSNVINGKKLTIIACNPDAGTGATFTWPTSPKLYWPAGTPPTQTTTAGKCDLFTFAASQGTSTTATTIVFGGSNVNY